MSHSQAAHSETYPSSWSWKCCISRGECNPHLKHILARFSYQRKNVIHLVIHISLVTQSNTTNNTLTGLTTRNTLQAVLWIRSQYWKYVCVIQCFNLIFLEKSNLNIHIQSASLGLQERQNPFLLLLSCNLHGCWCGEVSPKGKLDVSCIISFLYSESPQHFTSKNNHHKLPTFLLKSKRKMSHF